jgi:hypothetical protein
MVRAGTAAEHLIAVSVSGPSPRESLHVGAEEAGLRRDLEAVLFSRTRREPSFYLGLDRPWLPLVLRGGIAYGKNSGDVLRD